MLKFCEFKKEKEKENWELRAKIEAMYQQIISMEKSLQYMDKLKQENYEKALKLQAEALNWKRKFVIVIHLLDELLEN